MYFFCEWNLILPFQYECKTSDLCLNIYFIQLVRSSILLLFLCMMKMEDLIDLSCNSIIL